MPSRKRGEAPVDVAVEDADGHAGALAVTEEGGVEHGVDGQVTRLGQRVGMVAFSL